jgi:predicted MPP superfamily phosphohydrolase
MSHDPAHWDAQVTDKTDIDLMLTGHTHGAQFGIVDIILEKVYFKRWPLGLIILL